MKVLLTWHVADHELAKYKAALPENTVIVFPPRPAGYSRFDTTLKAISPFLNDVDVIVGWVLPEGTLDVAKNLKLLCWMHAGCDELDFGRLKSMGVQVTNIRGANSTAVAEHAMALILGLAKRLIEARQAVVDAEASPFYVEGHHSSMLDKRTIGIVGLGGIGTEIAQRAKAFNMRVLGVRRHPERGSDLVDAMYGIDDLHLVLRECDYVVLAMPMTSETNQFFGSAEFDAMKPGAFLVNIARGNLVQEMALREALTSGKLSGYGADVWWTYNNSYPATYHFPVPSRTGVHKLSNVLGTGGQGSNAEDVVNRTIDRSIESLVQFASGAVLTWAIDLDLGY